MRAGTEPPATPHRTDDRRVDGVPGVRLGQSAKALGLDQLAGLLQLGEVLFEQRI